MFRKILLATDFSKPATMLIECIGELARIGLQEVILVHVLDSRLNSEGVQELKDSNEEKLSQIVKDIAELNLKTTTYSLVGVPSEEISRISESEKVDLIIMGSVGQKSLKEYILGSTVSEVAQKSSIPLLIEKFKTNGEDVALACTRKLHRVLIPVDFSSNNQIIIDFIKKLAGVVDEVILTHVVEEALSEDQLSQIKPEIQRRLDHLAADLAAMWINVRTTIESGQVSEEIKKLAEAKEVSLIALSSRGVGKIKHVLMGTTADTIIRGSSKPILLFPYKALNL